MAKDEEISEQFAAACQRSNEYPMTVLRTEVFGHELNSFQARLDRNSFFRPSSKMLAIRDLQETAPDFEGRFLNNIDDVSALINSDKKDPWCRFIMIFAHSSRAPLGCSREQLTMLLTYHQVMPSFLDLIFTFKTRSRPLNYALFRQENYLDEDSPSLPLPHLGRSGIQVQHAFNILAVERSDLSWEANQWPLRHAALYHSLDLQTGRAVYMLLKGDTTLAKRIKLATTTNRHLRPDAPKTPEQSFIASLQIHLIMLEWGVENWSEYIDGLEEEVRSKSVEAKVAPVATVASPVNLAQSLQRGGGILTWRKEGSDGPISQLAELDSQFSFTELQRVSLTSDEINRSILALEQSRDVVIQVKEQYRTVMSSYAFNKLLDKNKCKTEAAVFFRRVNRILRDMEVHRRRLRDLSRTVENDKYMLESINQYTSVQTSKAFQLVAHTSSDQMMQWTLKMHDIAIKTKKETLSMHVITVFTLIFLPGTFIATVFSSGVLRWDEDGTLGSDWVVRHDAIRLFLAICLPLTGITVTIWASMYWAARRWAERHRRDIGIQDTPERKT